MSRARETTLTFFVIYLSPLTSEVYRLVNIFFQNYLLPVFFSGLFLYLVGMKRRTSEHVQEKLILLSSLYTYLP